MTCPHPRQTFTLDGVEHHLPCATCWRSGITYRVAISGGVVSCDRQRVTLPVDVVPLDGWQDRAGWLWRRR